MNQPTTTHFSPDPENPDFPKLIAGVVAGDAKCEEVLFAILKTHLSISVRFFLEAGQLDEDDVLVESITAVFNHIRRESGFSGDLVRFAITIARNRCRNIINQQKRRPQTPLEPLTEWIANEDRSPLDILVAEESTSLLQGAINKLSMVCRILLQAFYFDDADIESIRGQLGLESVQGVYYRRTVCLRELGEIMMNSLPDFSSST